jgi:hypothetical protein
MKEYEADPPGVRPPAGKIVREYTCWAATTYTENHDLVAQFTRGKDGPDCAQNDAPTGAILVQAPRSEFEDGGKGVKLETWKKYRITIEEITEESGK